MSLVTFDIEAAPLYGQSHPELYGKAFDITPDDYEPGLRVSEITSMACRAVAEIIPHYNQKIYQLETAITESAGSCVARACLYLTLIAPFQHIAKGIIVHRYNGVGSHWFNTVSALQDDFDAVIDSYTVRPDKNRALLKLRSMQRSGDVYENYYGGVKNSLDLLAERREIRDFTTNQALLLMEDGSEREIELKTVGAYRFSEILSENESLDASSCVAAAQVYFNEMATAVVDTVQGETTTLAGRDLAKELLRLTSDEFFKEYVRGEEKQLANV